MREVDASGSTAGEMPSSEMVRERFVVASRCAKAVAGAGSVQSSAGTQMACTDVMEPVLVERKMSSMHGGVSWFCSLRRIRWAGDATS